MPIQRYRHFSLVHSYIGAWILRGRHEFASGIVTVGMIERNKSFLFCKKPCLRKIIDFRLISSISENVILGTNIGLEIHQVSAHYMCKRAVLLGISHDQIILTHYY